MCIMKHMKSTFQYQGLPASLERITRLPDPKVSPPPLQAAPLHSQADSSRKKPRRNHPLLSDLQSIFGGLHTLASAGFVAAKVNMLIKEFRIVLPVSVEEYQVGQLYAVAEASKNETGGGEGVEVLANNPYEKDGEKGQYTHKIYHLQRKLAPKGSLVVHEEAWNAYPYCKTVITVHGLEKSKWDKVQIVDIDIADKSSISPKDYNPEHDPAIFKSVKTGRGPLGPEWKLVSVEFKWAGLQTAVESAIHKIEKRVFTHFHRQLFCWIDKWIDLSMDDIRRMEDETKAQLDDMRKNDEVKGLGADGN
ncbi:Phosphatidylinositol transfer protein alpha isoform [Dissostichus eleginoides]|uniref:Phosphatidylinositol transfer protein alpha isoform n=1 Tax=Dissostichus eleginoides TaxID=100907 RepID=A0AAD9CCF6_DISEL|nr:Phosphatidylinositol transfer protein alpha isoform [Dissostichus eleginoides]